MPYGYPSGQTLVNQIVTGVEPSDFAIIRRGAGFQDSEFKEFQHVLERGKPASIDEFLESNPRYLEIGKLCIAQRLLVCESEEGLFRQNDSQHWYTAFFRQIAPTKTAYMGNRLSIITFNYDRSLEHFLYEAFRARFGATETEAADFVRHLNIIHVHGVLGALPWQDPLGFAYGQPLSSETIKTAIEGIKIIHEADGDGTDFERARIALAGARYCFFFGFGFHPLNTQRLGIPFAKLPRFEGDNAWYLAGTCYGVTREEGAILRQRLGQQFSFPNIAFQIHELMRQDMNYLYAAEGRP